MGGGPVTRAAQFAHLPNGALGSSLPVAYALAVLINMGALVALGLGCRDRRLNSTIFYQPPSDLPGVLGAVTRPDGCPCPAVVKWVLPDEITLLRRQRPVWFAARRSAAAIAAETLEFPRSAGPPCRRLLPPWRG